MNEQSDTRRLVWERATEWPLTVLAVLYLVAYAVPLVVAHPPHRVEWFCSAAADAIWVVFVADYLLRLALARHRWRFARHHLLDALVVLLPLLRPLRLLRLINVLRIMQRRASVRFLGQVASYVTGAVLMLIVVASLAVLDAEKHNPHANITGFPDALWWTIATISTVGYGDRYPTTAEGRFVAAGLMLAGIALLGVVTATIAAWFIDRVRQVEAAEEQTGRQLAAVHAELQEIRELLTRHLPPTTPT